MDSRETYRDGRVTRLAPSPTGALHLGNARTFLINWALARRLGWRIVLRIEDLDTPRIKQGADQQAIDDLRWLGLDWDEGPYYQVADLTPYQEALATLHRRGCIYPCACTRKEILEAQSAPHGDAHDLRYPGTCRPAAPDARLDPPAAAGAAFNGTSCAGAAGASAWRLIVPEETIRFEDEIQGSQAIRVHEQTGDFVVATKAGLPAYQLAVVVDDARQGVTDIVRGDDLLDSAARQRLLQRELGITPLPRYWHLPLVIGPDGRRLAKRHGDTRLAWYREQGVSPERIVGLLAAWSGVTSGREAMAAAAFRDRFELAGLPRRPAIFTQEDHAWLLGH